MKILGIKTRVVYFLAALPALYMAVAVALNVLGKNPVEKLMRLSGDWALYFLMGALLMSPLSRIFRFVNAFNLRRIFGLSGFYYALLHLLTFSLFEHSFVLGEMLKDIIKRPYITIGMGAFLLLFIVALTSLQAVQSRMKHWMIIHKLVYVIVPMAILHFALMLKAGYGRPKFYAIMFLLLFSFRIWTAIKQQPEGREKKNQKKRIISRGRVLNSTTAD